MISSKKSKIDKVFEKLPAVATWAIILFVFVGSFFVPIAVATFVLIFNVFFLYRSIAFTVQFILSLIKLRSHAQIDWLAKVKGLKDIPNEINNLEDSLSEIRKVTYLEHHYKKVKSKFTHYDNLPQIFQKMLFRWSKIKTINYIKNEIYTLKRLSRFEIPQAKDINHVIIIPHAKEPLEVLDKTLKRISKQTFNLKQIHIILGAEERDPEGYTKSKILKDKYEGTFGHIWISRHVLTKEEIIGKSSNMAAAGRLGYKKIQELGWNLKMTTVTSCDADSQLPDEYFAYLTYEYLIHPQREYKFYTGAILLYANIWRIDFFARVRNSLSSMYNVGKLVRKDKFIPFSTYSTSFWLVAESGFWTPWITPEDFHIFFKASFTYPHRVSTVPLFTKIMVDAAEGENRFETFKNNYYQSRRWQWGVSDDGWVLKNLVANIGKYPLIVYYRGLHVVMDHVLAPTSSILITLGANLPPYINKAFGGTVFGSRVGSISSTLINLTLFSLVIAIIFDSLLKPKRDGVSTFRKILTPLEWIVNPIVGLLLTSLPGLEAHTRLLFGKYLEYYITKKKA